MEPYAPPKHFPNLTEPEHDASRSALAYCVEKLDEGKLIDWEHVEGMFPSKPAKQYFLRLFYTHLQTSPDAQLPGEDYQPPTGFPDMTQEQQAQVMVTLETFISMLDCGEEPDPEEMIEGLPEDGRQYLRELLTIHLETRGDAYPDQ